MGQLSFLKFDIVYYRISYGIGRVVSLKGHRNRETQTQGTFQLCSYDKESKFMQRQVGQTYLAELMSQGPSAIMSLTQGKHMLPSGTRAFPILEIASKETAFPSSFAVLLSSSIQAGR